MQDQDGWGLLLPGPAVKLLLAAFPQVRSVPRRDVAQLAERRFREPEAVGPSPTVPTTGALSAH